MPQSILKKPKHHSPSLPNPPDVRFQEERPRETALHHAGLIQQRKDTESVILASTEALLDLPTSRSADPAHPSPSDKTFVTESLKPFQPSDYDALIEERNINGLCGYVLCPRPARKQDTKANFRILQGNDKANRTFKIVSRQSLEKWCSDDCGKRALYLKVQLDEEPSWTRANSSTGEINLLDDEPSGIDDSQSEKDLLQSMSNLDLGEKEEKIVEGMKALAIERGDPRSSSRFRGLQTPPIRENLNTKERFQVQDPDVGEVETSSQFDAIEGYSPSFLKGNAERDDARHEDILPII